MPSDNSRPQMADDIDACHVCKRPATSWADGPGGAAVGVCSEQCRTLVAQAVAVFNEYGPALPYVEPIRVPCPFCARVFALRNGAMVPHNDSTTPFVAVDVGVYVANRCPGSGCTPRRQ